MSDVRSSPQLSRSGVSANRAGFSGDCLRRLALTRAGLLRRNNMVYGQALAAGVPLVIVMGGGCEMHVVGIINNPSHLTCYTSGDISPHARRRRSWPNPSLGRSHRKLLGSGDAAVPILVRVETRCQVHTHSAVLLQV